MTIYRASRFGNKSAWQVFASFSVQGVNETQRGVFVVIARGIKDVYRIVDTEYPGSDVHHVTLLSTSLLE